MSMNALQLSLTVFTQRNFVADFLCVFEPHSMGLGATYAVHLYRLIGKRVVDFLLVLIELFSLGVTAEALQANVD